MLLSMLLIHVHSRGYIAGTTNAVLKHKKYAYDVLCDMDTCKIHTNSRQTYDMDTRFISTIMSTIESHALQGVPVAYSEDCIRSHFHNYTNVVMKMATGDESMFFDENKKTQVLQDNANRFALWKITISFLKHFEYMRSEKQRRLVKDVDLDMVVMKLKYARGIPEAELLTIFDTILQCVTSEVQVLELLEKFQEADGGLFSIAAYTFHKSSMVRNKAAQLLHKIEKTKEGQCGVGMLNSFLSLQYNRCTL